MNTKEELPIIGKTYYCYDDGKINHSKQYKVKVVDIIEFDKAPSGLQEVVQKAIEKNSSISLFQDKTDYIVIGISYETDIPVIEIFIRAIYDWFGIGEVNSVGEINDWFCSGHLDVTGKLTKQLE